jgi:large subunit ribosomal protein L10
VNRDEKVASVAELHERFSKASVAIVASNLGLTAAQARALRRTVRAAGGEFKVAKHTLGKIAMKETPYAKCESLLVGPRGLVFGYSRSGRRRQGPGRLRRAERQAADRRRRRRGAAHRGRRGEGILQMPSLPALQARIVSQALSPGSRIASSLQAPAQRIAGVVQGADHQARGRGRRLSAARRNITRKRNGGHMSESARDWSNE